MEDKGDALNVFADFVKDNEECGLKTSPLFNNESQTLCNEIGQIVLTQPKQPSPQKFPTSTIFEVSCDMHPSPYPNPHSPPTPTRILTLSPN